MKSDSQQEARPIPVGLNMILVTVCSILAIGFLWWASHTASWIHLALAAFAFSYINNTNFALLHESVHGILHPNKTANEWMGRVLAALFPTGLAFQRICHLTHHQNNRSEVERFDYIHDGDCKWMKRLQWYGILTGFYWTTPPVGCLLYFIRPSIFKLKLFDGKDSRIARQTSADAMVSGFENAPAVKIRLEILLSILIQVSIFLLLDLSLIGWFACYAAFAVNWSSLQYADHAWSEIDARNGAWNLRVNKLVRSLFLNYHHHKAHHQHPNVSWFHLSKYVDESEFRPRFLDIYLSMWKGPRPFPNNSEGEYSSQKNQATQVSNYEKSAP